MVGPGHFGLLDLGDGIQKFSLHYEADLDRGGASVLDTRPLQWKDGWPVAGENMTEGAYRIESVRTGTVIEMAVEGLPVGGRQAGRGGGRGTFAGQGKPIPSQDAATHTIYRPANLTASKHPLVLWGEGGCAKNGLTFPEYLRRPASGIAGCSILRTRRSSKASMPR